MSYLVASCRTRAPFRWTYLRSYLVAGSVRTLTEATASEHFCGLGRGLGFLSSRIAGRFYSVALVSRESCSLLRCLAHNSC